MSYLLTATDAMNAWEDPAMVEIIEMDTDVRDKLCDLCIRAGKMDVTMIARIWDEAVEYFTPDGYSPNTSDIVRGYYRLIETERLYSTG